MILVIPTKKKRQWLHLSFKRKKTWNGIPYLLHKIYTILVYIYQLFLNIYFGLVGIPRLKNNSLWSLTNMYGI